LEAQETANQASDIGSKVAEIGNEAATGCRKQIKRGSQRRSNFAVMVKLQRKWAQLSGSAGR
jgi:hypothetical protein